MPGIARRYRRYWPVLLLVLGAALASRALLTAESPQAQREAFLAAERTLQDTAAPAPDLAALRDYPLYPYLRYQELTRRLVDLPVDDVRDFLREYADSPLARRLRAAWLRQLIQARRWDDYLRDYAPATKPFVGAVM
jgi:soluble lytic murein transglycosylase